MHVYKSVIAAHITLCFLMLWETGYAVTSVNYMKIYYKMQLPIGEAKDNVS